MLILETCITANQTKNHLTKPLALELQ